MKPNGCRAGTMEYAERYQTPVQGFDRLSESKPIHEENMAMRLILASCFCVLCGRTLLAEKPMAKPSVLGREVTAFSLKDYRGKTHKLSDYADQKLLVIAYLGTECPLAKLYAPRLESLSEKYKGQGVAFLGINANRQDSLTEIAAHARIHDLKFPVLKDLGNQVADQMGAVRTPEVFVLDKDRKVRYHGRIDDQYGVGFIRENVTREDLAIALDELLAGKPVSEPLTEAVGCFIGRVREVKADGEVTWSNQISRLFQKRCVECHREGDIAPFSLTNYEEVAGWGETIAEVIEDNRMPPWHADPKFGHFKNERRLSDAEKKLVYQWVADGCPEGDSQKLPAPRTFLTGWQLPKEPDQIITMRDKPYDVPAEGTVRYQYFQVDPGFTEDKWIKMAEVQPGNRAVVHHILVIVRPPEGFRRGGLERSEWLAGYVPGMRTKQYPEGSAKLIPAGSKLVFQVHYTPNGSPQKDLSRVGLIFAKPEDVTKAIVTTKAVNHRFRIPPGDDNHLVEATSGSLPVEVELLAMMPHMHLRGKSFHYEAVYPDGKRETLLDVPAYDFNWQTGYVLKEPLKFPAGTRMHCVAHFDNSQFNPANPDPGKTVTWGDQTWNEMMIGYFDIGVPIELVRPDKDKDATERAAAILKRYDKNQNGQVERSEPPKALLGIFDKMDQNGDKILTETEILKAAKQFPNLR